VHVTAGYFATLLLWHFPPNERFLLPVLPILLAGLSEEVILLDGLLRKSLRSAAIPQRAVAAFLVTLSLGFCLTAAWSAGVAYLHYLPQFFRSERTQFTEDRGLYAWIATNAAPDALFLAYKDTRLAIWTGRKAIRLIVPPMLYYDGDRSRMDLYFHSLPEFARRQGITHVVVSATDSYSLDIPDRGLPIVERLTATDTRFRLRYRSERVALYEINREGGNPRGS